MDGSRPFEAFKVCWTAGRQRCAQRDEGTGVRGYESGSKSAAVGNQTAECHSGKRQIQDSGLGRLHRGFIDFPEQTVVLNISVTGNSSGEKQVTRTAALRAISKRQVP